jgi:hypothetical protein
MSQKKKMDRLAKAGYEVGFSDSCEFWELALGTTERIGPRLKARIMAQVTKLIKESEKG